MTRRAHARVFAALTAVLVAVHVFAPSGEGSVLASWIPWDLGYHLLWLGAAAALVVYMTNRVWPEVE